MPDCTAEMELQQRSELGVAHHAIRAVRGVQIGVEALRQHLGAAVQLTSYPFPDPLQVTYPAQAAEALDLDEAAHNSAAPGIEAEQGEIGALQADTLGHLIHLALGLPVQLQVGVERDKHLIVQRML